jgi:hypothetical protein
MARFLRVVRQGRWSRPTWKASIPQQWQADALGDLATQGNALSVFLVETQQTTNQVIAGLAATRKNLTNFDYTVIDSNLLTTLGVRTEPQTGETLHPQANDLHHNIVELTAINSLMLVRSIPPESVIRVSWKSVGGMVKQEIEAGYIERDSVSNGILDKIFR